MEEQEEELKKELGERLTQSLLDDIETFLEMASEGYLGRALAKAQKPHQKDSTYT